MYNNSDSSDRAPTCSICNMSVSLNEAKTDEEGSVVHEECYLIKVGVRQANGHASALSVLKRLQQKVHD